MATGGHRVLVAGIGNVFRTDDGFGCEVVRRLGADPWPDGVQVIDYGIRGLHLAYDLLDPWDALVIVDALPDRGDVGAVGMMDVGPENVGRGGQVDAHGMDPATAPSPAGGATDKEALLAECVEQVLSILQAKQER